MKKFLLVFYMFITVQMSFAQLSGPLSGTLGPGEFHVADTISVESGDTLILMPGTTFNFDGPYPFNIYGTLLAEGTESDSIIFTTDTLVNPDRWRGLRFSDSLSSGSCLTYCLIQYSIPNFETTGGGVSCYGSSPNFEHCTISNNYAGGTFGGGGGLACVSSSASFKHCVISGNTTTGVWGGSGGGVFCLDYSAVFTECTITGNRADFGGGVCGGSIYSHGGGTFINCTIAGNSAEWSGGGACGGGTFENCIIAYNSAGWEGGGAHCGDNTFTNCVIIGNTAGEQGSGVYCRSVAPIFNSTIIAFSEGDGIYFDNAAESQITYCNMFGNSGENIAFVNGHPYQGPPGIGQIDMTNINGDSCDPHYNIFLDPMFVDTAASNYHLLAASPCIDAGDPELPLDPDSTIADIGAFYFDQLDVDEPAAVLPMTYALHPNWPNPFNPTTNIRYDVPQAGHIRLIVYNLLGQEVTRFVDKRHLPGSYTVSWNAANWPSGLYLCRMEAGEFTQVRKLLLVK